MIHLVKSNYMEALLEKLLCLMEEPLPDPMQREWISVQSRGMRQWLSLSIARHLGISSNIFFAYPRQMIREILTENQIPGDVFLDPDKMLWSVMKILNGQKGTTANHSGTKTFQGRDVFSFLNEYADHDTSGKKQVQLCFRLAQMLDNYQVWRPDLLSQWHEGAWHYPGRDRAQETWQAALWQQILTDHDHDSGAFGNFIRQMEQGQISISANRMVLFGISTMPPNFLRFFHVLSFHIPVYLFVLSPSNQFFMDMVSEKQMSRIRLGRESAMADQTAANGDFLTEQYYETGNPLLSSLGKAGQQFHEIMEEFGYSEPFGDLFTDPVSDSNADVVTRPAGRDSLPVSMLHRIQSDIFHLTARGNHSAEGFRELTGPSGKATPVLPEDDSISIHSCHSPLREAQVVKDLLLDAFEKHPWLRPHDVVVMMPDIEAYAPIITSVFSLGKDQAEPYIPFCISDRKRRIESSLLNACIHILEMKDSRMERDQVLELLSFRPIAEKFQLSSNDVEIITDAVLEARIFWGRDKNHRKQLIGSDTGENTWIFGLNRLFLGYAMDGEILTGSTGDVLGCPFFEGAESEILGRFSQFCHSLFASMDLLEGSHSMDVWASRLHTIFSSMMDEHIASDEMNFLFTALNKMETDAKGAGFSDGLPFAPVFEILKRFLDTPLAQGGFATGSVTFCNLVPMRSIPFQVVVLMGMDESRFPRQESSLSFDLMAKHPQKGDKNVRDEDQYLFLETILSARQKFIITYTGKSMKDNSDLPCSGVVSQLMEVMEQNFVFPAGHVHYFSHFLHGFHPEYFTPSAASPFFSYSPGMFRMALSQQERKHNQKRQIRQESSQGETQGQSAENIETNPGSRTIALPDLLRFFEHPAKYYLEECVQMYIAKNQDIPPDREEFQIRGLDKYLLEKDCMKRHQDRIIQFHGEDRGKDTEQTSAAGSEEREEFLTVFRAAGRLPPGGQGELEFARMYDQAEEFIGIMEKFLPEHRLDLPIHLNLEMDSRIITGSIGDLYGEEDRLVRCVANHAMIHPGKLLGHWVVHLLLSSCIRQTSFVNSLESNEFHSVVTRIIGKDPEKKVFAIYEFSGLDQDAEQLLAPVLDLFSRGCRSMVPFFPKTGFALAKALEKEGFPKDEAGMASALQKAKSAWFQKFTNKGEKMDPHVARVLGQENQFLENEDPFASVAAMESLSIPEITLMIYEPLLSHLRVRIC